MLLINKAQCYLFRKQITFKLINDSILLKVQLKYNILFSPLKIVGPNPAKSKRCKL